MTKQEEQLERGEALIKRAKACIATGKEVLRRRYGS